MRHPISSNITTIEPIILSLMFNNFKIVHGTLTASVQVENNSIKDRGFQICQSSKESEIEIQIGFNKIIQDWNKFIPMGYSRTSLCTFMFN